MPQFAMNCIIEPSLIRIMGMLLTLRNCIEKCRYNEIKGISCLKLLLKFISLLHFLAPLSWVVIRDVLDASAAQWGGMGVCAEIHSTSCKLSSVVFECNCLLISEVVFPNSLW